MSCRIEAPWPISPRPNSIDLQSDPLAGQFFAFNFFNEQRAAAQPPATFTRQFDSQADRASSDFDQRQNLMFYGIADLSAALAATRAAPLLRNWQAGWMGAIRSGFPYTVFASQAGTLNYGVEHLFNVPADLLSPQTAKTNSPYPPGRRAPTFAGIRVRCARGRHNRQFRKEPLFGTRLDQPGLVAGTVLPGSVVGAGPHPVSMPCV